MAPGSATFAGTYGDGMITVGGQEPDLYRQILQSFDEGVRATGRNPDGMPRLIELNVAYTADKETAIAQQQKYWAGSFVPAMYNQKIYTPNCPSRTARWSEPT